jgi:hypothetical protein
MCGLWAAQDVSPLMMVTDPRLWSADWSLQQGQRWPGVVGRSESDPFAGTGRLSDAASVAAQPYAA